MSTDADVGHESMADPVKYIRRLWATTLECPVLDDTDFFDVGGHSFAAMTILSGIDERLGRRVALRTLYDHPRFGDFATIVASMVPERT